MAMPAPRPAILNRGVEGIAAEITPGGEEIVPEHRMQFKDLLFTSEALDGVGEGSFDTLVADRKSG